MDGLALSERYFTQAALPLLRAHLPELAGRCAAGLCAGGLDVGCGSEVYGYDDLLSRDHNWGPRFFLFLSEPDYAQYADAVRTLFAQRLPAAFEGLMIAPTTAQAMHFHVTSPLRNAQATLDISSLPVSDTDWYVIPEHRLAEYAAGSVYYDPLEMLRPLKARMAQYPANVLRKRLAGAFFMMHAAGNALRCAKRGEFAACRGYVDMAVASAQRAALLLHRRYTPHIKWRMRALRELPSLPAQWLTAIERLALRIDPSMLEDDLHAVLLPVGEMLLRSDMIAPLPLRIDSTFLPFNCYGLSKALEETLQGELAGRPLAIALDQMSQTHQPLSTGTLSAHWQAGRPGISLLL